MVFHFAELDKFAPAEAREQIKAAFAKRPDVEFYLYPGCDHAFAAPERASFNKPATLMAHSRSIALFRKVLGPHYDLSALWDRHTELEFARALGGSRPWERWWRSPTSITFRP